MNLDLFKILNIFYINFLCVVCMCLHVWLHSHTCGGESTLCRYLLALCGSSESNHVISFESRLLHPLSTLVNPKVCISNTFQNQILRSLFLFRLRRKSIELKRLNWKFENIGVMKPICLFVFSPAELTPCSVFLIGLKVSWVALFLS